MTTWRQTWLLALWEFRRFFKWKGQLISSGISLAFVVALALVGPRVVERARGEVTVVGVIAPAPLVLPEQVPGLELRAGDTETLRAAYEREELDALLTIASDAEGTLESRDEGGWIHSLQAVLDATRQQARLRARGLAPEVLADVTAPFALARVRTPGADGTTDDDGTADEAGASPTKRVDVIIASALLAFMVMGLFTGTALLFTGITSEKQQLVTEQIVAAVPPQTWIDGKILGNGMRATLSTIEMLVWSLAALWVWRGFVNPDFGVVAHVSVGFLVRVGLLAVLGYAMWFCAFAAVAATIDDPNTSARGMLLLLPMVAPALAIPAYVQPDGVLATVLGLLPPTATMVLTVRLALTDVPGWQLAVAVLGMLATAALMRRAAGRVFAMGILMRGKEPTWQEMWSAARASG